MDERGESVDAPSKVSVQNHSTEEVQQENPKFTKRQILTFISLSLANFFDCSSFSLIAPIYPKEAKDNEVGSTVLGLIFGSFSFVMFIVSPICGKILPKVGAKFMFLSGEFLCAGANIIFGFLNKMDNKTQFVVFSFVVRGVSAAGAAAAVTAMFAIIANTFPGNVAKMIGMLEVFSGLGYMLGPLIGGALDQVGGFSLPFLSVGVAVITIIIVNVFLLPNDDVKPMELGSYSELWRIPAIWFTSFAILTGSLALGFIDPTLANHLDDIDPTINPTQTGAIFLLVGGVYALTSPFWGWLADKKNATRPMIVGGFFAAFISYLLIGPSPLTHLPAKMWVICVGLGFLGVSIGCGLTPTFQDMLVSSKWYGMSDDLPTHSLISGHFNSMFSIGTFAGPVLGGFLVDHLTFKWASTIFAFLSLGLCFVFTIFNLWEFRCFKGRRPPSSTSVLIVSEDETAPLLGAKS